MYKYIIRLLLLLSALQLNGCIIFGDDIVFQKDSKAILGYDTVSYFNQNKPLKGLKTYQVNYSDATWYFSNKENKQKFLANPKKYIPQYGGYCAYAMSVGFIVSSDPYAFTIKNDKLYLNYSKDVRKKWLKDADNYIKEADVNWQGFIGP